MTRVKDEMTVKVRAATIKTDCQNIEVWRWTSTVDLY